MIKEIHSVGLTVADLDKSIDFYCTEDAYALVEHFDIPDTKETRAAFDIDNAAGRGALLRGHAGFLELNTFSGTRAPAEDRRAVFDAGLRHVCLRTRDADSLFDQLDSAGSHWHARPHDLGTGLAYAYIRDPEGNLLELEGLPMMPPGVMKPWFDHIAIVTHDIHRLASFYEMLTGMPVSRRGSFGPEEKFDTVAGLEGIVFDGAWILFGLSRIEMWQYASPQTQPAQQHCAAEIGWSHLCLEVDNLDLECDRLAAAGVTFTGKPRNCGLGRSVFFRDVDGNRVKLLELPDTRPELSIENLPSRPILKQVREASENPRKGG